MAERSQLIAVLGDSRVFDTYFVNAKYGDNRYGADKTFPFLLRRALLGDDGSPFDLVHIADHFRSGTIANNIIRLALSDPAVVVLLDGIWETLVNKELFVDYANRAIRGHRTRSGKTLDLSYSSKRLAELFVAGELAISPARYAERQARIISYFRRRRRQCVWLTLPVPPPEHLDRVHYAGDYRCIPEWGECLSAINRSIVPMVERWGGMVLDLDAVIRENGGYGENLIDQWHFSAGFHARIAERLGALIDERGAEFAVPADHASHAVMLGGDPGAEPVVLVGKPAMEKRWAADNPNAAIEARLEHGPLDGHAARIVVVVGEPSTREALACDLLGALPADKVLVYAEELGDIDNPVTDDHKARQVDIET